MTLEEAQNVRQGDVLTIDFKNGKIENAFVVKIISDKLPIADLQTFDGSSITIDTQYKWDMLFPALVEEKALRKIGFTPIPNDDCVESYAYGKTASQWVCNIPPLQTFTLTHSNDGAWQIQWEAMENGQAFPIRFKTGLVTIPQIQEFVRNPQNMEVKQ